MRHRPHTTTPVAGPRSRGRGAGGFTLIELLVTIMVILILLGILIPVVGVVRRRAQAAATRSLLTQIASAVQMYHTDHGAYPGPLSNNQIGTDFYADLGASAPADPDLFLAGTPPLADFPRAGNITMSENLALGLFGGLRNDGGAIVWDRAAFDSARGPASLNTAQPKQYPSYLDRTVPLSADHYKDVAGDADDTQIPEILDAFNDPMPILYMRAKTGAPGIVSDGTATASATPTPYSAQYDLSQIIAYTGAYTGTYSDVDPTLLVLTPARTDMTSEVPTVAGARSIGIGKKHNDYYEGGATPVSASDLAPLPYHGLRAIVAEPPVTAPGVGYYLPYAANLYLKNPSVASTARQKDGYILISAGEDRVYGTDDDITNFGTVAP